MANVLIPLANGVEEIEAVTIIDVLRRAQWTVVAAGMSDGVITASRGVRLVPDKPWQDVEPDDFDVLLLPGGSAGTQALQSNRDILETIRNFIRQEKIVGAICAAPLVLQAAGIMAGREATCHPAVRDRMKAPRLLDDPVVISGNVITSQGPGTTIDFALAVIEMMDGQEASEAVAEGLVF